MNASRYKGFMETLSSHISDEFIARVAAVSLDGRTEIVLYDLSTLRDSHPDPFDMASDTEETTRVFMRGLLPALYDRLHPAIQNDPEAPEEAHHVAFLSLVLLQDIALTPRSRDGDLHWENHICAFVAACCLLTTDMIVGAWQVLDEFRERDRNEDHYKVFYTLGQILLMSAALRRQAADFPDAVRSACGGKESDRWIFDLSGSLEGPWQWGHLLYWATEGPRGLFDTLPAILVRLLNAEPSPDEKARSQQRLLDIRREWSREWTQKMQGNSGSDCP